MTIPTKFSRAKPYKRTPNEIKAVVRFRDGYRCIQCGMTAKEHFLRYKKTLDVHRINPGSPYTVKGCVTLCRKCHGPQPRSKHGSSGIVKFSVEVSRGLKVISAFTGETPAQIVERLIRPIVEADFDQFIKSELAKKATDDD